MIEQGSAKEADMIAAFLRAEFDSSRFSDRVKNGLQLLGRDRALADRADTANAIDNRARRELLQGYRGYPDQALFTGFPSDTVWRRVMLEPCDFRELRYANDTCGEGLLMTLSKGTRRVTDGAMTLIEGCHEGRAAHILEVVGALKRGQTFAPLICVEAPGGSLVLMEGHSRSTAYVMEQYIRNVEAFVGKSPSMSKWIWY
jgi:hypothetical protein